VTTFLQLIHLLRTRKLSPPLQLTQQLVVFQVMSQPSILEAEEDCIQLVTHKAEEDVFPQLQP
jgi:hypothetical protein